MGNLESLNNPIIQAINRGKDIETDFLLHIENTNETAQLLVSFANTNGGLLIIGVNEFQKFKGINPIDEKLVLEECVKEKCIPSILYSTSTHQIGRHLLLVVKISKTDFQCRANNENGKSTPFYRIEGNVVQENKILKKSWLKAKYNVSLTNNLSENTTNLLKIIISSNSISLSQLYKISNLPLKEVDEIIVSLIHCGKIQSIYRDKKILYSYKED